MNSADLFKDFQSKNKKKDNLKNYNDFLSKWKKLHPAYTRRDFFQIFVLVFVLITIPITIYLTVVSRDNRSRASIPNVQDIDVTFIERTPRYDRYNLTYSNRYPRLTTGTSNTQNNPKAGDTVTFKAYFKNAGNAAGSSFNYKWYIDSVEVKAATHVGLAVGEISSDSIQWVWQTGTHSVKFVADPANNITEISKVNNSREDKTDAIYLRLHVEQSVYDNFNQVLNIVGTYSFEDWAQAHIAVLNQKIAEGGGLDSVRAEFVVQADGSLPNNGPHAPVNWDYDGVWGFDWGSDAWCIPATCDTATTNYNDITYWATRTQAGLVHEWSHQMGMSHSYDANVDLASNNLISGERLIQTNPEIVGAGGDDVGGAFQNNTSLTPYFIYALNTNHGYRRGYYADYLFDIPDINILKIKDGQGNNLTGALLKIWQKNSGKMSGNPTYIGVTDVSGNFTLPNQTLTEGAITTETKHTLKANPFGNIDVVGGNGSFLIEINVGAQKEYKFMTVHDFNLAYWKGAKTSATYTLQTSLVTNPDSTNLALNKTVTSSCGSSCSSPPSGAVDGNKISQSPGYFWEPLNGGQVGDWWKVDLGASQTLYKVTLFAAAVNYHDWYSRFHIEVSLTGAFTGEQTLVATENNWDLTRNNKQFVDYTFNAVPGRYIRIVSDIAQGFVKLQEFEAFRLNTSYVAPTVSISSPANNAVVSGTTSVTVNTTGGSLTKVEYYINGALSGSSLVSPYTYSLNTMGIADGKHNLYAKVYDGSGNVNTSQVLSVTIKNNDNQAPILTLLVPASGATLSGTTTITATASDNVGVQRVDLIIDFFTIDGRLNSPYNFILDTTKFTKGTYTIAVLAYDSVGNSTTRTAAINIDNTPPDTQAPSVPTNLTANSISTSEIDISWTSSIDNVGVVNYKIFRDSAFIGTASSNIYQDTELSPNTTYSYTVQAADAAGNLSVQTPVISATTKPITVVPSPTGSISADSTSLSYGSSTTIRWSTQNVTSCSVSPGNGSGTSGALNTGTLTSSKTYTLSCSGAGGNLVKTVVISIAPPAAKKSGDLNSDAKVNIYDLSILLSQWGKSGSGDLNSDNKIDIYDLSILLSKWGT